MKLRYSALAMATALSLSCLSSVAAESRREELRANVNKVTNNALVRTLAGSLVLWGTWKLGKQQFDAREAWAAKQGGLSSKVFSYKQYVPAVAALAGAAYVGGSLVVDGVTRVVNHLSK